MAIQAAIVLEWHMADVITCPLAPSSTGYSMSTSLSGGRNALGSLNTSVPAFFTIWQVIVLCLIPLLMHVLSAMSVFLFSCAFCETAIAAFMSSLTFISLRFTVSCTQQRQEEACTHTIGCNDGYTQNKRYIHTHVDRFINLKCTER